MKSTNLVKILGLVATVVGAGATLLTNWVEERRMEEKIDERIDKRLAELSDEDEES
jgi:low affinity Fe/Cu permease